MSAGKGDKPRPVDGPTYRANYDAIFGRKYPEWVCRPCGWQYGRFPKMDRISAWHEGTCGICGQRAPVTEPRDFGHLRSLNPQP
jgi:hypothetical protein